MSKTGFVNYNVGGDVSATRAAEETIENMLNMRCQHGLFIDVRTRHPSQTMCKIRLLNDGEHFTVIGKYVRDNYKFEENEAKTIKIEYTESGLEMIKSIVRKAIQYALNTHDLPIGKSVHNGKVYVQTGPVRDGYEPHVGYIARLDKQDKSQLFMERQQLLNQLVSEVVES